MSKVAIVTDGSSDLSDEIIKKYDISVVPLRIIFGSEIYKLWGRDKCEISTEDFHVKLEKISKEDLPTSSVPSPGLFVEAFENALSISDSVIAIFVGAKLSATVESAQKIIQNYLPGKDITIFDSKQAMMGIGIQVLEAARMAKEGKTKKEILERLAYIRPRVNNVFVLKDLNYLHKQGRIGRAKKIMASAFNMSPVVSFEDGIVIPLGVIRGEKNVVAQMTRYGKKILEHTEINEVFIYHVRNQGLAQEIFDEIQKVNTQSRDIHLYEAGNICCVISGPKSVCLCYIGEFDKDWLMK